MSHLFERRFLGWDAPPLRTAAGLLLDSGDGMEGVLDLSGELVVLPGSRPGRRLRELLLEGATERGLHLVPPRVVTAGALPEALYTPRLPPPPPSVSRRAWTAALGAASASDLHLLMPRPPGPGDAPAWFSLAGVLEEMHRELGGELVSFEGVADACGRGLLFDDEPRWRVLTRIQTEALRRLEGAEWLDREAARLEAIEGVGSNGSSELGDGGLWLVAVPELSRAARELLASLADSGALPTPIRVLVNAPESEAEAFDPDGVLKEAGWLERTVPLGDVSLQVLGGPREQALAALVAVARASDRRTPDEIALVAADPELAPYFAQRLDGAGVQVRRAEGTPFERTAAFRLLELTAAHLAEGRASTFAALVRHPDLDRWLHDGGIATGPALRALDSFRERHLPARIDQRSLEVATGKRAREVEALRARVEELLEPLRARHPLAGWAEPLTRFLLGVYGERTLRDERAADRPLLELLPALATLAEEFGLDAGDDAEMMRGDEVLRMLGQLLAGGSVPPPADDHAVELLGWLELALDDAPVLVLGGANDPHLPAANVGHPFLPDALRAKLGVTDNRRRRARDAYLLTSALAWRDPSEVTLLVGRRTAAGDPLRPSPLLLTGDPETVARRILRMGEGAGVPIEGSATRGESDGAEPAAALSPEPAVTLPPEARIPLSAAPIRVPISSFGRLLANPYLWALERERKLERPDDGAREMSPLSFGLLLHGTVEALGRELLDATDPDELERGLVARLRELARREFGARPFPAVRVQLAQAEGRLRALAEVEARSREEGWRVVAVEAELPRLGVPFVGDDIYLTGRVDRVDRHPDGRIRILDYKTGETVHDPDKAHRRGRRGEKEWVDLQLPLYRHLAAELRDAKQAPVLPELDGIGREGTPGRVAVGYYAIPRDPAKVGILEAEWSDEEVAAAVAVARAAVEPLRAGYVEFDETRDPPRDSDPLASLFGVGILRPPDPGDEDDDD